jgi:hypothetical protein
MTDQKPTLSVRVATLRKDPRVAAFSLIGPGGQVFGLVNEIVTELEALQRQVAELEKYGRALGGIASCATQCKCCQMHAEIARNTLGGK